MGLRSPRYLGRALRHALLLGISCIGCGRLGFEVDVDASVDVDGSLPGDGETMPSPWSQPTVLSELGTLNEDPTVSEDRLKTVWATSRTGNFDLWMATRTSMAMPYSNIRSIAELNSATTDEGPELSADGNTLNFVSNRGGSYDIYVSSWTGSTWSAPTVVTELSSPADELYLALTPDGLTVLITRSDSFFRATRASTAAPFGPLSPVPELAITADAGSPTLGDGEDVYFHAGAVRDIYFAPRMTNGTYATPAVVPELFTLQREADPFILGGERYMVFNCMREICETTR